MQGKPGIADPKSQNYFPRGLCGTSGFCRNPLISHRSIVVSDPTSADLRRFRTDLPAPMSKRTPPFQSVWRDVEEGRFTDRKYANQHPLRTLLPTRPKSQFITAAVLFLLTFMFTRSHYSGKVERLQRQIEAMGRGEGVAVAREEKFAIVTFETRDVSYWRESLGNKYLYAQRHG